MDKQRGRERRKKRRKKEGDEGMKGGESVRDCVHLGSTCTWLVGAVSRTIRADRYLNMTVMDVMRYDMI